MDAASNVSPSSAHPSNWYEPEGWAVHNTVAFPTGGNSMGDGESQLIPAHRMASVWCQGMNWTLSLICTSQEDGLPFSGCHCWQSIWCGPPYRYGVLLLFPLSVMVVVSLVGWLELLVNEAPFVLVSRSSDSRFVLESAGKVAVAGAHLVDAVTVHQSNGNTFASIPHKWSCRWWVWFVGEWDTVLVHPAHKPVIVLVGSGQTDVSVAGYHFVDSGTVDQWWWISLGPVGK